jgi:hypothetical protein
MNKEQQVLLNEAYENYKKEILHQRQLQKEKVNRLRSQGKRLKVSLIELLSQEEFINKCKTDKEFSEKWGLKIEERELSLEERHKMVLPIWREKYGLLADMMVPTNVDNTPYKIPTKLITITYNDKTIENYE